MPVWLALILMTVFLVTGVFLRKKFRVISIIAMAAGAVCLLLVLISWYFAWMVSMR